MDNMTRLDEIETRCEAACEIINALHTERLDYHSEYLPLIESATDIPGMCSELRAKDVHISELEAEVARLREAQRWIQVTERLPEEQAAMITDNARLRELDAYADTGYTPVEVTMLEASFIRTMERDYNEITRLLAQLAESRRREREAVELIRGNCKYCAKSKTCHARQGPHAHCWIMRGPQEAGEGE